MDESTKKQIAWSAVAWGAAVGAAWLATRGTQAARSRISGHGGDDDEVTWREAILWAVVAAVVAGVARSLGRKGAARAWTAVIGEEPPGL